MQPGIDFAQWSIPVGRWFGVQVRVHLMLPLAVLLFAHWVGWQLGLICSGLLLLTVLVHEFAHIVAARMTDGDGDTVVLWPLGGLALCRPGPSFASQFLTPAAGPLSHVVICLATLPAVWKAGLVGAALNPTHLPIGQLGPNVALDLLVLLFALNWFLLLINLVPAYPLDGGQMLLAVLATRLGVHSARWLSIRVGSIAGLALAVIGLFGEMTTAVFLGFFLITANLMESFRLQLGELYGEGAGGFDIQGGHVAENTDYELPTPRVSLWQQWKQNRAAARRERELEARAAATRRLDELLDKIQRDGMASLTAEERRFLDQASNRYRTQQGRQG